MYKLMVVAGPNRGTSFTIHPGENWIGRQAGNAVVLVSSKISKRHCLVTVRDNEITVSDPGSANGTFVNGALMRTKQLQIGDRISVGEFVLQLMEAAPQRRAPDAVVLDFPNQRPAHGSGMPREQFPVSRSSRRGHGTNALALNPYANASAAQYARAQAEAQARAQEQAAPQIPTDLKGKLLHYFDTYLMPIFYGLNLKNEWRMICGWSVAGFILANLVISVQPLLDSSRSTIIKEVVKRARYMARQVADQNSQFIAAHAETKTEIGAAEHAEGVRVAVLTDLSNRIIAPALKQNSYLANGPEAMYAVRASKEFKGGRESGLAFEVDEDTVAAYEPVKIINPAKGRNEVVGMAIISIDTSQATASLGEMSVVYSETLILTGILAAILLLVLYKLTLKPFQVLVDDMDRVLKGDMNQVTQEFKWEELQPLYDLINSALQRVPKRGSDMLGGGTVADPLQDSKLTAEEAAGPLMALADAAGTAIAVCDSDRKVVLVNGPFEEITGIRGEGTSGQELAGAARDQAFSALITDLFDRAAAGTEAAEDFEFSGVDYVVRAVSAGSTAVGPKAYALLISKKGTE
jgi:PAS domain-containing protein